MCCFFLLCLIHLTEKVEFWLKTPPPDKDRTVYYICKCFRTCQIPCFAAQELNVTTVIINAPFAEVNEISKTLKGHVHPVLHPLNNNRAVK